MDLLDKIIAGTNDTLIMELDIAGYEGDTLEYRKLSINETKKYQRIINKSLGTVSTTERNGFRQMNGQEAVAELNIAESSDAEYKADIYLVKTSLTIDGKESLNDKQIEAMPSILFEEIVKQLKEANNLNNTRDSEKEVKKS